MAHNSEGRSKANPPALTPSHRSGYNYLSEREVEKAGFRMALELQQSGRGTTRSGAKRDADVEQDGEGSLNLSLMDLLFLFSLHSNCYSLICHSQTLV